MNNITINEHNMELFWKYITERHTIYKKKTIENLNPPWTNDPILRKYKFTNVFRDLDPGTKYVLEKIIPKCTSPENIIFNIITYRIYNKIQTFDKVGIQDHKNFNRKLFEKKLRKIKDSGEKVFTNAFIVSGYSFIKTDSDKIGKTSTIVELISKEIPKLTDNILKKKNSKHTFNQLKRLTGIGNFLAYQIAVDIGYWNKSIFNESEYTVAGPGCKSGIDRVFTNRGKMSYEDCIKYLVSIQTEKFNKLKIDQEDLFSDRKDKKLNLMAIENCLCEFSKYCKVYYNEGRPRNTYNIL